MNPLDHLTNDQFAECALELPTPAVAEHLSSCAQCRAELETFSAAMQGFRATAVHWSEAQPRVSLRGLQAARPHILAHPHIRWAMAAALAAIVALPVVLQGDRSPKNVADAPTPAAVSDDSPEVIAEDNRLMERVNLALNTPDPSPLDEYDIAEYGLAPQVHAQHAVSAMRSQ